MKSRGSVRGFTCLLGTTLLLCLAGNSAEVFRAHAAGASVSAHAQQLVSAADLLARAGITPDLLAAVCANEGECTAVLLAAHAVAVRDGGQSDDELARTAGLRSEAERLEAAVLSGQAQREDVRRLAALRGHLRESEEVFRGCSQSVLDAAEAALADDKRALFRNAIANGSRALPTPFRVTEMDDRDWTLLRDAYAVMRSHNARLPGDLEEPGLEEAREMMIEAESRPEVVVAQGCFRQNRERMRELWASTVTPRRNGDLDPR